MAPHGGLFVYMHSASMRAFGTAYGPHANEAAFDVTAVELEAYAPPSSRIFAWTATSLPSRFAAVLHPDPRRVAVDVADERLLAVVDELHRPVRVQGEHRAVDLHREVLAPAERPADAGQVDAHPVRRQAEARRHLVAVDVEPLRGHVDVDAALAVGHGQPGLGAEEGLVLDAELVGALDRDLALRVRVAVADDDRADDVGPRVVAVAVPLRPGLGVDRLAVGSASRDP